MFNNECTHATVYTNTYIAPEQNSKPILNESILKCVNCCCQIKPSARAEVCINLALRSYCLANKE